MKLLCYISVLLWGSLLATHDVAIAIFQLTESNNEVELAISLDAEDFLLSSKMAMQDLNVETIQSYLRDHLVFHFGDDVIAFTISEVKIKLDHIKINGGFGTMNQEIKSIKIKNTCMIDVPKHSNIIQIDLNHKSRDFRMHKGRTIIDLEY